jgi:NmrA-like family
VEVKKINYDDQSSLVEALRGQEVLIITMAVTAPRDQETKLIEAAAAANVPWVMPNEYGGDPSNVELGKDTLIAGGKSIHRSHIEKLGKSSWIALICGFWYEYSLAGHPIRYGFDFKNRTVTFFDDGNTRINTSTWPQCGHAVARLLSLKVLPDDENDKSPCLANFRNNFVYISSFNVSQRDMLDSVLRVTGTSEEDWKIDHEDVKERYKKGVEDFKKGEMTGFVKLLYSRVFFPDGSGNYEAKRGLHNDILGLPQEDFDEYTKVAVQMAEKSG